jgi:hypothetical protein
MQDSFIYLDYLLEAAIKEKTVSSCRNRKYAIVCLQQFLQSDRLAVEGLTKEMADGYVTWLVNAGKANSTVELYRKVLRKAIVEAYPQLEERVAEAFDRPTAKWNQRKDGMSVDMMRKLARLELDESPELRLVRDIFLFGFYCGGLDFKGVKMLTKASTESGTHIELEDGRRIRLNANIEAIVALYNEEGQEALFPEIRTMKEGDYQNWLRKLGTSRRWPMLKERDAALRSWITVAYELGVEPRVMLGCTGRRSGVLSNFHDEPCRDQATLDRAINRVSIAVADSSMHWYAMRFRDRRTMPEDIYKVIQENDRFPYLRDLTTYYPCEEIVRRVGDRRIVGAKAYINGVMFFRTKPQYVKPLFSLVSDLAWIYSYPTSDGKAVYAMISQREMENFQSAVSKFTPDVACQIVSNDEMVAGRRVRVLSGQFAGTEGVIEDDASAKGPMRRFAVRFTSANSLVFKLNLLECDLELLDK